MSQRVVRIAALAALVAFAVWDCLHYGRLGLRRLDQSIVFDGGWRIVSGQLPFRDFTTPAGLVPIAMQALLFRALGVTWLAYCLHAAIVNALFAVVALVIARQLGAGFWTAWLVGAGSAVVFYPLFGVPYMDQHSFFFSTCCLSATISAFRRGPSARMGALATPSLAALAFFSKLMPATIIVVPCVLGAAAAGLRKHPWWVLAGLAVPTAAGLTYTIAVGASVHDLSVYMFALPLQTASSRTMLFPFQTGVPFWPRAAHVLREWAVFLPVTRALIVGLWLGVCATLTGTLLARHSIVSWRSIGLLLLSVSLSAVTGVFAYVTNNRASNGVALLPLSVGMAWLALGAALDGLGIGRHGPWRAARATLAVLVVVATTSDVWQFQRRLVAKRALNGFDRSLPQWSPRGSLHFLVVNDAGVIFRPRDLLTYVESRPDNFLLFGDSAYVYGATGHPSVFPALWFHPGLTMPRADSPEFPAFEARVLSDVSRYHVRYVIQEGSATFMRARLRDFPRLTALVAGCPTEAAGAWTVLEICR